MSITVVFADDHRLFRAGVGALLADHPDIGIVGEAEDGLEAVNLTLELRPDVVLMDLSMDGMNGVEATRRIVEDHLPTRVLCLSMHSDRRFVAAALEAGASGYLVKTCCFEELAQALRAVANQQTYLSPAVAGVVVADYAAQLRGTSGTRGRPLTRRECEVLQLLAEGHSTGDIAERLHVSRKTVGTHREHVMKKLDIHSVAGLTKYAIRTGLTTAES